MDMTVTCSPPHRIFELGQDFLVFYYMPVAFSVIFAAIS